MSLQKATVILVIITAVVGSIAVGVAIIKIPASLTRTAEESGRTADQPPTQATAGPLTDANRNPETLHVPGEIFGIIGTMRKIEGRTLTIEGTVLSETSPSQGTDLFSEVKYVTLAENAKLTKTTFIKKADIATEAPKIIPQRTAIAVEDLRVGMQVQALAGKNVPNERSFNAISLNVL